MQEGFEETPYKKKAVRGKFPVYYSWRKEYRWRKEALGEKKVWGWYKKEGAAEQACKSLKKKYKWWEFSVG